MVIILIMAKNKLLWRNHLGAQEPFYPLMMFIFLVNWESIPIISENWIRGKLNMEKISSMKFFSTELGEHLALV